MTVDTILNEAHPDQTQAALVLVDEDVHDVTPFGETAGVTFTITVTLPRALYSALACLYPDGDIANLLVEGAQQRALELGAGVDVALYRGE